MKYDYEAALMRTGFTDSDVNKLRAAIKKIDNVPKKLDSKRVRKDLFLKFECDEFKDFFL